jgi:hypothetical protein
MSRYYWVCRWCGSEADDTTRTGVQMFGEQHRCVTGSTKPAVPVLRPKGRPRLSVVRIAGHRRKRVAA